MAAAVVLLIEHDFWLHQPGLLRDCLRVQTNDAWIGWGQLAEYSRHHEEVFNASPTQRAILSLAVALATDQYALTRMDDRHARMVAEAWATAAGYSGLADDGYDPEQHARVMAQPGVEPAAFAEVAALHAAVRQVDAPADQGEAPSGYVAIVTTEETEQYGRPDVTVWPLAADGTIQPGPALLQFRYLKGMDHHHIGAELLTDGWRVVGEWETTDYGAKATVVKE
jgi:hypothetical protein